MNLSELFIRRPVMTVALSVSVILFGLVAYSRLPVSDLPAVDYPVIQVQVNYPGATPETMANNVATPLERQFMQIPGLELVTSNNTQGHTNFVLQFDLSKSLDGAATDVQAAITRASGQLPVDLPSPPTFTKTNPNDQPIMYLVLVSDTVTEGQLYDYANTQVGERLSILPGVSQVAVYGTQSAVRVKADPSAMAIRNITLEDLTNAIKNGTSYTGAGQFDGPHRTYLIQPQGQLSSASEYDDLIVGQSNGAPVYLKDVATAKQGVQDERIDMRFWARGYPKPGATVVVAVFRAAGANAVAVSKSVRDVLPSIQSELPSSVLLVSAYDRSQTIVGGLKDVQTTLYIAFVLVVIVIFIFLGRATDTLIPAVALPLSLLLTFIAMKLLGYSLDNLSLMALTLAIGFLVDDAIVFLENTVRLMEDGMPAFEASLESAKEISFTIMAMTLSLAAVFLPLVIDERPDGAHLPRVLHHHRDLDYRQRPGFADAYSADDFAVTRQARQRRQEDLDGARLRCYRAARAECLRALAVVLPAQSLDLRRHVDCLSRRHRVLLLHRPEGFSAGRRQFVHPRRDGGAGRIVADADAQPIRARRRRSSKRIPPCAAPSP